MTATDLEREREISIALEEYKNLQLEKQIYIQGGLAVPSIVVLGTITAISIVAQFEQWWILIALPFAQIGILGFSLFASAMSLRHGMYLAVVEKRIERLAGKRLLNWETRGVENWPKYKIARSSRENSLPNLGITLYFYVLLVFIVAETIVSARWYWYFGYPAAIEAQRHIAATVYLFANLIAGFLLIFFFLRMPKWAEGLYAQFAWEELFLRHVVDIHDGFFDPRDLIVREERGFWIYVRNLSKHKHIFAIPAFAVSIELPPGKAEKIAIEFLPGSYSCLCEMPGAIHDGEQTTLVILDQQVGIATSRP